MKCPKCGNELRPSKKYPGQYLCDHCRKRFSPKHSTPAPENIVENTRPETTAPAIAPDAKPKKKKKKKKKWPMFLILAFLVIACIGIVFFFSRDLKAPETDSKEKDAPKKAEKVVKIYGIDDEVTLPTASMKLVSYETSSGEGVATPEEGNEFVLINYSFTNKSETELPLKGTAAFDFFCDDSPIYLKPYTTDLLTSKGYTPLDAYTMAINESYTGWIVLEVPAGWQKISINYFEKVWNPDPLIFEITK